MVKMPGTFCKPVDAMRFGNTTEQTAHDAQGYRNRFSAGLSEVSARSQHFRCTEGATAGDNSRVMVGERAIGVIVRSKRCQIVQQ